MSVDIVQPTDDVDRIIHCRYNYNEAISQRNVERFATYLSPSFIQLSSDGCIRQGIHEVARSYAEGDFLDPSFISYERIPDAVELSENKQIAVERGHWIGHFAMPLRKGMEVGNTGLYQAGWEKCSDGVWRLKTEAYVKLELNKVRFSKI